jgi:hypothetical protein
MSFLALLEGLIFKMDHTTKTLEQELRQRISTRLTSI